MFVIVSAWNNLSDTERALPLDRKMALTLKHAGVSITVTSITDIVAFGIGGSTVSLQEALLFGCPAYHSRLLNFS